MTALIGIYGYTTQLQQMVACIDADPLLSCLLVAGRKKKIFRSRGRRDGCYLVCQSQSARRARRPLFATSTVSVA